MSRKAIIAVVAVLAAVAAAVTLLFTVGPLKPSTEVYEPAGIEAGSAGEQTPGEETDTGDDRPAEEEPVEPATFDREAAIAFARSFYSDATFTEDGWTEMQDRAAACGVVLDDSLKQPFEFYGSQYPDLAFSCVTFNSTYTREQESPEVIRIAVEMGRAQDVCGDRSYDATVSDIKGALEDTLDLGTYSASVNLVLTVSEDGSSATLTVDNPDWYIEQ